MNPGSQVVIGTYNQADALTCCMAIRLPLLSFPGLCMTKEVVSPISDSQESKCHTRWVMKISLKHLGPKSKVKTRFTLYVVLALVHKTKGI